MKDWIICGEFLTGMRQSLRLSRAAVAQMIGVDPGTIRRLETGKAVIRRKLLESAYYLALEKIQLEEEFMRLQVASQYLRREHNGVPSDQSN